MIKALIVGDIIGRPGRTVLQDALNRIRLSHDPDIVLVNGENAAGGFGITEKVYNLFVSEFGVDCVTTGNHWHDKKELFSYLPLAERLFLPGNVHNTPSELRGLYKGVTKKSGIPFAVINVIGRVFMHENNKNPFEAISRLVEAIPKQTKVILVDVHAEASSEKLALGDFLTCNVSLVFGTHSHVPTADGRLLENFTGFITDVGMTGPYDSIIGMKKELALKRMLTGNKSVRLEPAKHDLRFYGILAEIDEETGQCCKISRVIMKNSEIQIQSLN